MPKYLSGRVKRTPQGALTTDRYQYLGLEQAEPNLGDPPEVDAIPSGTQYQIVSLIDRPGERFWKEVGGGIVPGSITVRDEGLIVPRTDANPNLGISSITDINFVGAAITVAGFLDANNHAGTAVTVTISAPGEDHGVLFNNDGEFATSPFFTFDNTIGIGSVGIGTSDPSQNLHVVGNVKLDKTIYDEENQPGNTGNLLVKTVTGGLKWQNASAVQSGAGGTIGQVQYHGSTGLVEGAENFYFDYNNDRVGIGSTIPDRLLDVLGDSRFTGFTTFTNHVTFERHILIPDGTQDGSSGGSIRIGDSQDMQIFHYGNNGQIRNDTGDLVLRSNDIFLESTTGEKFAKFNNNSSVELFFDNVKKFETTTNGIDITGTLSVSGTSTLTGEVGFGTHATFVDDAKIKLGDSEELELSHQKDGETVIRENGTGNLNILGSNIIFKNSSISASKTYAEFKNGDSVNLFFNNAEKFQTTGLGVSVTGLTSTTDLEVTRHVISDLIPNGNETLDIGSDPTSGGNRWNIVYAKEFRGKINVQEQDLELENLLVTGISTFVGVATFGNGIHVQSGVSTFSEPVGILSDLYVSGISTFVGITTQRSTLFTEQISNVGVSTFFDTVNVKTAGGSVIQDASGTLDIRSNILTLTNNADNQNYAVFTNGAGVELLHSNVKKLETTSAGINVTGDIVGDSLTIDGPSDLNGDLDVLGISTFRDHVLIKENIKLRFTDTTRRITAGGVDLDIKVSGAHDLNLKACADAVDTGKINIVNVGSGITVNPDSSVDVYHEASKKLETTVHGIDVTGHIETDTLNVTGLSTFGPGVTTQTSTLFANQLNVLGFSTFYNNIDLFHTGGSSIIQNKNTTLDINSNTLNLKDGADSEIYLAASVNDKVQIYYRNALKFQTSPSGISVTGSLITSAGVSTIGGHVYPSVTDTHNLGKDATLRWNKVYAAEYYGTFKGGIDPGVAVEKANKVKITNDNTVAGTHYIHFGDDATTDNYDNVEVDSTGLKYENRVLIANKISAGISTLGIATANTLYVAGVSTFAGITTVTGDTLFADELSIAGVSTFFDTVNVKTAGGSVIQDASGTLDIKADVISLKKSDNSETLAIFRHNSSSELYFDNVKRLETSGIGVTITGELHVEHVNATGVVTATDFNSTSDIKLKTNIQVIDNPIDKIMKIDGVSFNWKATNKPSLGVIANNVEEILPDLVSDNDPKTVNYNGLVGLLIEVVKNQQNQINELRGFLDK